MRISEKPLPQGKRGFAEQINKTLNNVYIKIESSGKGWYTYKVCKKIRHQAVFGGAYEKISVARKLSGKGSFRFLV